MLIVSAIVASMLILLYLWAEVIYNNDYEPEIQRDIDGNVIRRSETDLHKDVGSCVSVVFPTGYGKNLYNTYQRRENIYDEIRAECNRYNHDEIMFQIMCDRYKHLRGMYAENICSILAYNGDKEFIDIRYPNVKFGIERLIVSNTQIKKELDDLKSYLERHSDKQI